MISSIGSIKRVAVASLLVFAVAALPFVSPVSAKHFSEWGGAINVESITGTSPEFNSPFSDGCPIESPDGLSLYFASNRPGDLGGLNIWVAHRPSKDDPWGAPESLPAPVNSDADDFCPTPVPGHGLFFVSARSGGCGGPDIYFTRRRHDGTWEEPRNLGCDINSPGREESPSYFEDESGNAYLYFSSNRAGGFTEPDVGTPDSDIYFSVNFGPRQLAPGLNTASDDSRPNVRKDGLEIVFDSNRSPTLGGTDIWTASRESTAEGWSELRHLGFPISTEADERRATLSRDGLRMYFGSNRVGSEPGPNGLPSFDIYMTTREKVPGKQ